MYSFCLQFLSLKEKVRWTEHRTAQGQVHLCLTFRRFVGVGGEQIPVCPFFVLALSAFSTPDNPISHWRLVHYSTQPFYLKTCRKLAGVWCHRAWKNTAEVPGGGKRGEYPMLVPLLVFTTVRRLFPLQIKITPKLYDACRFLISTRNDCTWRIVK